MTDRGALWAVAAPLVVFKVCSIVLLLIFAPTADAVVWVAITSWYWVLAIALLVAVPVLAWTRLVRMRARREELRRQEWMLDTRRKPRRSKWERYQWSPSGTVSRREGGD
jgi:heme/copper-type cytochrome/quinol oxidase subunit 2